MQETKRIAVIGGSGLYKMEGVENIEEISVNTPFGVTSDKITKGTVRHNGETIELYFLPRHGVGHRITPSEVNSRANIYALKKLGVKVLLSVSAVGSMKKEIAPGDIVLVDQFIDRTKSLREHTFFGNGIVGHVPLGHPVCPELLDLLRKASATQGKVHQSGTYICIEGPQFSTKAESNFYRMLGVDVIGMTACPEYKLAREAELHFGVIALSTDYDCWKEDEAHVTVDAVMEIMKNNVNKAKKIILNLVPLLADNWAKIIACSCEKALQNAVMTDPKLIPPATYSKISLFLDKYMEGKK